MITRIIIILLIAGCLPLSASPNRVIVVINSLSTSSVEIGEYYTKKRQIPSKNIFRISVLDSEGISREDFHEKIRKPLLNFIIQNRLADADFIVTTKGVPLYINNYKGMSVDSMLVVCATGQEDRLDNPYYNQQTPFESSQYQMFLVTRLDGFTVADAKALVDRSLASDGKRGKFLLDLNPFHDKRVGYVEINQDIRRGALALLERGIPYILEKTDNFAGGYTGLMGYYSWGSNDTQYDKKKFLSNRFVAGAIAETVVSTSARTFIPEDKGQSLIGELIHTGITGIKGYTTEPYGDSMAKAAILFDRYTKGYNLAESFYMASPYICWKDVVIGDPLAAPYAIRKQD